MKKKRNLSRLFICDLPPIQQKIRILHDGTTIKFRYENICYLSSIKFDD